MAKTTPRSAAAAQEEKTTTYIVTSPMLHNAATERYEIDDEIELTEAQATPLLGVTVKLKDAAKE